MQVRIIPCFSLLLCIIKYIRYHFKFIYMLKLLFQWGLKTKVRNSSVTVQLTIYKIHFHSFKNLSVLLFRNNRISTSKPGGLPRFMIVAEVWCFFLSNSCLQEARRTMKEASNRGWTYFIQTAFTVDTNFLTHSLFSMPCSL